MTTHGEYDQREDEGKYRRRRPAQACSMVVDYPNTADEQDAYLQSPAKHPTREEVEIGSIRLAAFSPYEKDESHATLMYARAAGLTLVHLYLLGENHWVARSLRDLNSEEVAVIPIDIGVRGTAGHRPGSRSVTTCRRVSPAAATASGSPSTS